MGLSSLIEIPGSGNVSDFPLSRFFLNKSPDSFDVRVSQWAGTVCGYALSQTHTAAAGTLALIGMVQDLLFLFLGETGKVHLRKVAVREVTGPLYSTCPKRGIGTSARAHLRYCVAQ
jgi:hypothetical protein